MAVFPYKMQDERIRERCKDIFALKRPQKPYQRRQIFKEALSRRTPAAGASLGRNQNHSPRHKDDPQREGLLA